MNEGYRHYVHPAVVLTDEEAKDYKLVEEYVDNWKTSSEDAFRVEEIANKYKTKNREFYHLLHKMVIYGKEHHKVMSLINKEEISFRNFFWDKERLLSVFLGICIGMCVMTVMILLFCPEIFK